ncbi:zinc finger protein ZAT1-like [Musa acuminata AAA Group]|uniref:zinc finger protein ZAT1-like n=1 Tax=Musa acuminata AAA Group TaxID=214697 RepID=UPI0031CF3F7C
MSSTIPSSSHSEAELKAAEALLTLSRQDEVPRQRRFICNMCKREFGTRQSLGGHRASHRGQKGCYERARERRENRRQDGTKRKRKRGREAAGPPSEADPVDAAPPPPPAIHREEARKYGPAADGSRTRKRMRKETMEMSDAAKPIETAAAAEASQERRYICSWCNKQFSSWQALGGHRTNHKGQKGCSEKAKEATEEITRKRKKKETESSECKPIEAVAAATPATSSPTVGSSVSTSTITAEGTEEMTRGKKRRRLDLNLSPPASD